MCSARNTRWQLVSEKGAAQPKWQLFDLKADYGEQTDVAAQHPEVVEELAAAFDKFWSEALPLMVNEKVVGPKINPFQELYYQQFGGSPTAEDLAKMDPNRKFGEPAPRRNNRQRQPRAPN
jgi:arylsulfatase